MYDIQEALLADESTRVFLRINDTWIEFYGPEMGWLVASLDSDNPIEDYPGMDPTPISIQEALGLIQEKSGNFPDLPEYLFD